MYYVQRQPYHSSRTRHQNAAVHLAKQHTNPYPSVFTLIHRRMLAYYLATHLPICLSIHACTPCMCIYIYTSMLHICIISILYTYIYLWMCVCLLVCERQKHANTQTNTDRQHTYTYIYTYTQTCVQACMDARTCTRARIHTYIHTYFHFHFPRCRSPASANDAEGQVIRPGRLLCLLHTPLRELCVLGTNAHQQNTA